MSGYDVALAPGPDGKPVLHAANCKYVRRLADKGVFVATLFGCRALPDNLPRHSCLDPVDPAASAAA